MYHVDEEMMNKLADLLSRSVEDFNQGIGVEALRAAWNNDKELRSEREIVKTSHNLDRRCPSRTHEFRVIMCRLLSNKG